MIPDDPGAALRDIADHLPGMRTEVKDLREEVQKDRRVIKWLIAACAVLACAFLAVALWTAHQQTVIDSKSAAIDSLVHQNTANAAADARNARDLCVRLTRTRAELLPVWEHVLSEHPGDTAAWLPRVMAAEPLPRCPKAPAGS